MTLLEAVSDIGSLGEDSTIYAAEPWTESSRAIISPEPDTQGLSTIAELGLRYFLEVSIAREILHDWLGNPGAEPTPADKCARLIAYAENDA